MKLAKKITTAAALAAALLAGTAPKAAAQCPYTVGPLGRYIAPAIVQGMTATDDGAVEVWCTDALDGDDWYFVVDAETDLRIYDRVDLVVDANGTPEDFSDDKVIDALYCHDYEGNGNWYSYRFRGSGLQDLRNACFRPGADRSPSVYGKNGFRS